MSQPAHHIVVDASALLEMLGPNPDPLLFQRLQTSTSTAPEIIDLEVLHVLRRQDRLDPSAGADTDEQARLLPNAPVARVPHRSLIGRIWELRHSVTAYDAAYVALAEQLDIPLVTCDAKLAGSHGHKVQIELYPGSPRSSVPSH